MSTLPTSCAYDQFTLEGLSNSQLLAKQAKNRQVGRFMLLLVVFTIGMAFVLESYLVAVTSWAMIPALDDYNKKRKAISKHLQKRNIG